MNTDNNEQKIVGLKPGQPKANSQMEPAGERLEAPASVARPGRQISKGWLIGGLILVVVLLAGIGFLIFKSPKDDNLKEQVAGSASTSVALINGQPISQARYDFRHRLRVKALTGQGVDLADPETTASLQAQIIDELVQVELLLQQARNTGVVVEPEAIEAEFQAVVTNLGGQESLDNLLQADQLTINELKADIEEQLIIRQVISNQAANLDLTVTEEEIQNFYTAVSQQNPQIPPLEAVHDQISAELNQQKINESVDALIEQLRSDANIEILL